jgi:hypothetical protein
MTDLEAAYFGWLKAEVTPLSQPFTFLSLQSVATRGTMRE